MSVRFPVHDNLLDVRVIYRQYYTMNTRISSRSSLRVSSDHTEIHYVAYSI
jgi:hypothetical protein